MTIINHPDIKEFRELYEKADSFAREVADFRNEVVIPAHTQLRYAGHHFVKAMSHEDPKRAVRNLKDAEGHCRRAMYDAAEARIIQARQEIGAFVHEYRNQNIQEVVSDLLDRLKQSRKAGDLVVTGRAGRESPEAHVEEEYMPAFRRLRHAVDTLEAARPSLNALARDRRLESRRTLQRNLFLIAGIAVTLLIGILTLACG